MKLTRDKIIEGQLILKDTKIEVIDESFYYSDLSSDEQNLLYVEFKKSYEKAVGKSWDKNKFERRAYNWLFFGSIEGGIAVRRQRSGMYKLNASFGSPKKIIAAFKEMDAEIGDKPIWGAMTINLVKMLEKLSGEEYKQAPGRFVKLVIPHISHIFGDVVKDVDKDGGILIDTPVGVMKKYFIANKAYYYNLLDMAEKNPDKLPIPKIVLKPMFSLLRRFI